MSGFRMLLLALWLVLLSYTDMVIAAHGLGLLPIFLGDIARLAWPGQFNLDFTCFLMLSAVWTAWRSGFSQAGLVLAVVALFGGAAFLLPYLIVLSYRSGGDVAVILLGAHRAGRRPSPSGNDDGRAIISTGSAR